MSRYRKWLKTGNFAVCCSKPIILSTSSIRFGWPWVTNTLPQPINPTYEAQLWIFDLLHLLISKNRWHLWIWLPMNVKNSRQLTEVNSFGLRRDPKEELKTIQGVVDKILDTVDSFYGHFRTQRGRLPWKLSIAPKVGELKVIHQMEAVREAKKNWDLTFKILISIIYSLITLLETEF